MARLRPRPERPSPPPCGWSTGFIAVPRTVGRIPSQRLRPALPKLTKRFSLLETSPIEAQALIGTLFTLLPILPVPGTVGRIPSQRLRPALPKLTKRFSLLETSPIEAQALIGTLRTSLEGILRST